MVHHHELRRGKEKGYLDDQLCGGYESGVLTVVVKQARWTVWPVGPSGPLDRLARWTVHGTTPVTNQIIRQRINPFTDISIVSSSGH